MTLRKLAGRISTGRQNVQLVKKTLVIALVLMAGVAAAKEGVTDPTVKTRMELMDSNAMNAKILGEMAAGKTAFDATAATAAKAALAANAATIPVDFKTQATDPVSDAKPEIWANWDDFTAKAEGLLKAAEALDASSAAGLQASLPAVGGACKACHSTYKLQ
jgi:cytochrome c556